MIPETKTPIFSTQDVVKYAEQRLFGLNVRPKDVGEIRLYNGFLPSEVVAVVQAEGSDGFSLNEPPIEVLQGNQREPIYFSPGGILHIPQYSGFGRRRRYEMMIEKYIETSAREIGFHSLDVDAGARRTNIQYDNFAYDFVKRLFEQGMMVGINDIVIGPLEEVAKQSRRVIDVQQSEYLDTQVVELEGKKVLNIGYVYADQAGIILGKMLREYEARAREDWEKKEVNVLMFGRVGGLQEEMRRGGLVFPCGIIDSIDLERNHAFVYPMHNVLLREGDTAGLNLNVATTIEETVEQLLLAKELGCSCVEMETRETVEAINRARRRYEGKLNIHFGFVGHVSDVPLRGDTLATELSSHEGEERAVARIVDYLQRRG